jgi:hypothetical protein
VTRGNGSRNLLLLLLANKQVWLLDADCNREFGHGGELDLEVRKRNEKPLPHFQIDKHEKYSIWGRFLIENSAMGDELVLDVRNSACS